MYLNDDSIVFCVLCYENQICTFIHFYSDNIRDIYTEKYRLNLWYWEYESYQSSQAISPSTFQEIFFSTWTFVSALTLYWRSLNLARLKRTLCVVHLVILTFFWRLWNDPYNLVVVLCIFVRLIFFTSFIFCVDKNRFHTWIAFAMKTYRKRIASVSRRDFMVRVSL